MRCMDLYGISMGVCSFMLFWLDRMKNQLGYAENRHFSCCSCKRFHSVECMGFPLNYLSYSVPSLSSPFVVVVVIAARYWCEFFHFYMINNTFSFHMVAISSIIPLRISDCALHKPNSNCCAATITIFLDFMLHFLFYIFYSVVYVVLVSGRLKRVSWIANTIVICK